MGRGSLVGRRAMSGRVKRTDGGEGSEMCVQGSERRSGGGRKKDGVANGEVMDV